MFSQTTEYALRAMVYLAANSDASNTAEGIAELTRVPAGYLSKIMRDLVVAKLVISQRGPNGGFMIARAPSTISVLEIVNAVDPIARITHCPLGNPAHVKLCPLHQRLDDAIASIESNLKGTVLSEILTDSFSRPAGRCGVLTKPTVNSNPPLRSGPTTKRQSNR